jgi:hypothetical protein
MLKSIEEFYVNRIAARIEEWKDTWQFQTLVDYALNDDEAANHLISRLILGEDQQFLIDEIGHDEIDRLIGLAQDKVYAPKVIQSGISTDELKAALLPLLERIGRGDLIPEEKPEVEKFENPLNIPPGCTWIYKR